MFFNENVICTDMRSSNQKAGTRENQLTGDKLRGLL